jgi:nucleotide-binding universal stress UspA family protein
MTAGMYERIETGRATTEAALGDARSGLWTVLVATDLATSGRRAVDRAARLPMAPGGRISIVHVRPGERPLPPDSVAFQGLHDAVARARTLAANVGRPDITVTGTVLRGRRVKEIAERARRERVDLLVVGRSRRRATDVLLHSLAERIVRRSPVPVLVVALDAGEAYRRPLAGIESGACLPALDIGLRTVGRGHPLVGVVHADGGRVGRPRRVTSAARRTSGRRRVSDALAGFLRVAGGGARFAITVRPGHPARVVLDEARRRGADLIALATGARRGLAHLLKPSIALEVLREASCDVLVAPAGRA